MEDCCEGLRGSGKGWSVVPGWTGNHGGLPSWGVRRHEKLHEIASADISE
jgi:hypothetical protein